MSTGLKFDAGGSRGIDNLYRKSVFVERRARALELVAPRGGESIIDIGCGPGYLSADLAYGVGPTGKVAAFDQSPDMLALAQVRCDGLEQVLFDEGSAESLPYEDSAFDAALSTQVFEYVPDVAKATEEVARVLKARGRAVILATDWETLVWHNSDPARMRKVMSAWDEHLSDPFLPRRLGSIFDKSGLILDRVVPYTMVEHHYDANTYSYGMLRNIQSFSVGRQGVTEDEAEAWAQDLVALGNAGQHFFSVSQFFFVGRKG